MLYNISNIIYHDSRITNIASLVDIDDEIFLDRLNTVKSTISFSDSNPVIRDYKQDSSRFNTTNLSYSKEIDTYSINKWV